MSTLKNYDDRINEANPIVMLRVYSMDKNLQSTSLNKTTYLLILS